MKIVVLGLSITSSWGNGHATTYRGLLKEFAARGHRVLFLERDVPWYASNRDLPDPSFCRTELYPDTESLYADFAHEVAAADAVIVGSYVPDGIDVGRWVTRTARGVTAFYDIDTPVTIAALQKGENAYLSDDLIAKYDLYLSFTGGPMLDRLESEFGSPSALPLYCSFDPANYYPVEMDIEWDLGYMGTYSNDRQPTLNALLLEPARLDQTLRMAVAGPQYPENIDWPSNVRRIDHVPPAEHRDFYNKQRFTLNVTRADMIEAGFSPSVRLFEAAACGVPIISDAWEGLDSFFKIGEEILVAGSADQVLRILNETSQDERRNIAHRARRRVMAEHTAAHRAEQLEEYLRSALDQLETNRMAWEGTAISKAQLSF